MDNISRYKGLINKVLSMVVYRKNYNIFIALGIDNARQLIYNVIVK